MHRWSIRGALARLDPALEAEGEGPRPLRRCAAKADSGCPLFNYGRASPYGWPVVRRPTRRRPANPSGLLLCFDAAGCPAPAASAGGCSPRAGGRAGPRC